MERKMYSQFCVREDSLASVIPKNNLISHANSISARDDAFTIRNERSHERERDAFSQIKTEIALQVPRRGAFSLKKSLRLAWHLLA